MTPSPQVGMIGSLQSVVEAVLLLPLKVQQLLLLLPLLLKSGQYCDMQV